MTTEQMTKPPSPYDHLPQVESFTLTSDDIADGETLATRHRSASFGAGGEDVSPQLRWSGFPPETKSFVVTCFDPDAPTGSGFWHWAVASIPAAVTELKTNAGDPDAGELPAGAFMLKGDAGVAGFVGAAPPAGHGPHHYVFAVHALDLETLPIDETVTPALLGFIMGGHTIARALITPIHEA